MFWVVEQKINGHEMVSYLVFGDASPKSRHEPTLVDLSGGCAAAAVCGELHSVVLVVAADRGLWGP